MKSQLDLGLADTGGALLGAMPRGELGAGDPLPPGPYAVGLTHWIAGDGVMHDGPPFTVTCGDGRAVAGHIPSREIGQAIADALNRVTS